jgi:ribosome assembly protein 4
MEVDDIASEPETHTIQARLISEDGEEAGPPIDLPVSVTTEQLELILNALLQNEERTPYLFFVNEQEVKQSIDTTLDMKKLDVEKVLDIIYQPQAVFRVRPVTRCTSSMPGHAEAVVSLSFSPDNLHLASGSGDTTLRLWDLTTETPHYTCTGHKQWVLCVAWAPDSKKVASADKSGEVRIWDPDTGKLLGRPMVGHKKHINCLSWQPYHQDPECRLLASAGSDGDIRIWDTVLGLTVKNLAGHTGSVTAVRWGGAGLLYSSSRDRTIKMWRAEDGTMCRTYTGHAHWVNNLALNTDYVLRTGPFHPVLDKQKSYKLKDSEWNLFGVLFVLTLCEFQKRS